MSLCERCQAEISTNQRKFPIQELNSHLTPAQHRILDVLYLRRGNDRWVTADTFRALLYLHKPDDPPENTLFSTFIVHIRHKLLGSRWSIESGPYGSSSYRLIEGVCDGATEQGSS